LRGHGGEQELLAESIGMIRDEENGIVIRGDQDRTPPYFLAKFEQDLDGFFRVLVLDVAY